MGSITDAGNAAFRDFETDGVPGSGRHNPAKADIRAAFALVDTRMQSNDDSIASLSATVEGLGDGEVGFTSVAAMQAALGSFPNGHYVKVLKDPGGDTTDHNGVWLKISGVWVWQRPLDVLDSGTAYGLIAAASAGTMPLAKLLARSADTIGTIRGASDTSPVKYFCKRITGAAVWTQATILDVS